MEKVSMHLLLIVNDKDYELAKHIHNLKNPISIEEFYGIEDPPLEGMALSKKIIENRHESIIEEGHGCTVYLKCPEGINGPYQRILDFLKKGTIESDDPNFVLLDRFLNFQDLHFIRMTKQDRYCLLELDWVVIWEEFNY